VLVIAEFQDRTKCGDGVYEYGSHEAASVNTRMEGVRFYRSRSSTRPRLRVSKSKAAHEDLFVRDLVVFLGEVANSCRPDVRDS
jgi:hypothetical protein